MNKRFFTGLYPSLLMLIISFLTFISSEVFAQSPPIKLHASNSHYFEFRNQPTVLISSAEHYGSLINLEFDYVSYLNEIGNKGLNYTRIFTGPYVEKPGLANFPDPNNLAPASGQFIAPWARSSTSGYIGGGNKFDLDTWDANYFTRLNDYVTKAGQNGIVVEVTFFCSYYNQTTWNYSPLKSTNNINNVGSVGRSEVLTTNNGNLQPVMDEMVIKICQELQGYDNVIYEIVNEPYWPDADDPDPSDPELSQVGVHMDWQKHIAHIIDSVESSYTYKHLIAQNMDNYSTEITNNLNKLTDAIPEASIFNFHYNARTDNYIDSSIVLNYGLNLPIGCDETGYVYSGNTEDVFRHQAWKSIMAGGSTYNNLDLTFDINHPTGNQNNPDSRWGGGQTLRTQLGYLSAFVHSLDFVNMTPHNDLPKTNGIISQVTPSGINVRCLADIGNEYAVYVYGGTQANLKFNLPQGDYEVKWFNTKTGGTAASTTLSHSGGSVTLSSPTYTEEDIALRIISTSIQSEPNLLGHWKLDETSGTTAYDATAQQNNGTLLGGFTFGGNSVPGHSNTALSFDGYNDLVRAGNPSDGSLDMGFSSFSVSNWFYITSNQNKWQYFVNKAAGGATGYGVGIDYTNKVVARFKTSSSNVTCEGPVPSSGVWHHVVAVYDRSNNQISLYLDGALEATAAIGSGSLDNNYDFQIGAYGYGSVPANFFKGALDDVRLYDKALSASEVSTLFNGTTTNSAPVVNAGPNQSITLPLDLVTLNGSVTDDGLPQGSSVTSTWSKVSGPGTVSFSNASSLSSTASFSTAGTYVLKLTASDTELSASDNMQVIVNNYISNPNLAGHWALDDGSGNIASDETSNSNDGTLTNNPVWTTGKIGGALAFDGVNDYVKIDHIEAYHLASGTFSFWFWVDQINGNQGLFSKDSYGYDTGGHIDIYVNAVGKVIGRFQSASQSFTTETSGPISTNQWHHLALTVNSSSLKLYIDGVLADFVNGLALTINDVGNYEPIALGARTVNSYNLSITPIEDFLNGKLDDVRIYDYVLSATEIGNLTNAQQFNNGNNVENTNLLKLGNEDLQTIFQDDLVKKHSIKNYPNPFSGKTTIEFMLSESNKTQLIVYNSFGQQVAILYDDVAEKGTKYSLTFDGGNLPQGVYYYRLISGSKILENKKMILQK